MAALNNPRFLCLPNVKQIDGVCVAVAGTTERENWGLDFFFIPLDPKNPSLDEWCKYENFPTFLNSLMLENVSFSIAWLGSSRGLSVV